MNGQCPEDEPRIPGIDFIIDPFGPDGPKDDLGRAFLDLLLQADTLDGPMARGLGPVIGIEIVIGPGLDFPLDRPGIAHDRLIDPAEEIFNTSRKISEYAHDNGVRDIFFVDTGARPVATVVNAYWKKAYPGTPRPRLNFLNPDGFVSREDVWDQKIDMGQPRGENGAPFYTQTQLARPEADIIAETQETFPDAVDGDSPVLLFDTCTHSGGTLLPIADKLRKAGVKDLRIAIGNSDRNHTDIDLAFVVRPEDEVGGCYTFPKELVVSKHFDSIISRRHVSPTTYLSTDLRRVLKDGINEAFDNGWFYQAKPAEAERQSRLRKLLRRLR